MHTQFLQQAVDLALKNVKTGQGGPYGALIVKDHQLIATGVNLVTHTLDPTAHAEIVAIRAACKKLETFKLNGCTLYTSCEPCPMCLGAIYWAGLEKVYFACNRHDAAAANFDDRFIYDQISIEPSQRSIIMLHLSLPNALRPFTAWTETGNKTLY